MQLEFKLIDRYIYVYCLLNLNEENNINAELN